MSRRVNILTNIDWLTVWLYVMLVWFGWMNIYAVNYADADTGFFSLSNRYTMQLVWIIVSVVLAVAIFVIDSRFYSFAAYFFYAFIMFLLALVVLVGKEVNNSKSWLMIGPVGIQPAEFAKLATTFALARFLSGYNIKPDNARSLLISLLIIAGPLVMIMLQPDFGSTLVFGIFLLVLYREGLPGWILLLIVFTGIFFLFTFLFSNLVLIVILIITGCIVLSVLVRNVKYALTALIIIAASSAIILVFRILGYLPDDNYNTILLGLALASIPLLILIISKKLLPGLWIMLFFAAFVGMMYSVDYLFNNVMKPHQRDRINVMLKLKSDPYGYEYNVRQSKIAIGSGGFSGKGFLKGTQTKFKFVPEQSTDFIFCTVGEEWGYLGSLGLIAAYVAFILRLIFLAERQRSTFSRVFGYGVAAVIFFHFAVNIAMTIDLFPVIGIPLPFLSYGGSSLMSFTIMVFVMLKLDSTRKAYLI